MSTERAIVEAVKSQIATLVNGAGSYTYDLTGADRVVTGQRFQPHRVPGVYVYFGGMTTAQAPGVTVLTRYDRTMVVQVEGWVAADSSAPGEAALDALDLGSDIMRAIETDRSLTLAASGVRDLEVGVQTADGQELDRPGLGLVVLQVSVFYTERAGV